MLGQIKSVANKENKKLNFAQIILSVISGILLALSFSIPDLSFLTWFALIPFFISLYNYKISGIQGFKISFIFSLTYYLGLLLWLFRLHPLTWVGFTETESFLLISLAWFVFSLIEALGLSLIGCLIGISKPKSYNRILMPVCLWIIIEWIQGIGATGFTWGRLALSQYENLHLIQSANLFGTLFISGLIIFTNVIIATSIVDYQKRKLKYIPIYFLLTVVTLNVIYGYYTISSKVDDGKEFNATIIQGNILSDQKWDMQANDMYNLYKNLTEDALKQNPQTNLVVWPESAVVDAVDVEKERTVRYPEIMDSIKELTKKNNIYLATGIFTINFTEPGKADFSNSIVAVSPQQKIVGSYAKRHLVPFGEYLPFRKVLEVIAPGIAKMNAVGHDILQGKDTSIINTEFAKIGGFVCFDSILPQLIRSSVKDGAEVLVLVTNDSWYKDSIGVYQHNGQSVFRAIETDRYMIRAANTGISSIISPNGTIMTKLDPLVKGFISNKVKVRNTSTLYLKVGDFIAILALIVVCFSLMMRKKDDLMLMTNE